MKWIAKRIIGAATARERRRGATACWRARLGLAVMMAGVSTFGTDLLTASLGRPVVLAYGKHIAGGNIIVKDDSDENQSLVFLALGEGPWDGLERLIVNGLELDITLPESNGVLWHFHKGIAGQLSSDGLLTPEGVGSLYPFDTDGDQKVDGLFPLGIQGLTFSKTAYLAAKIPFDVNAPSDSLSVYAVMRTRKVSIYDAGGVEQSFEYSENPAWQIADLLTEVRGLSPSRINWASFAAAAAYCDVLIDPLGDSNEVKRFVSHVAFTEEVGLDQALDAILITCRGFLYEDAGQVYLRIDQTRASSFDFTMENIVEGAFNAFRKESRSTPNRLELLFRDLSNDFQIMTKVWNHEPHQAAVGRKIVARVQLGNMQQQQAERIGNYLLTRAIDNNLMCRLTGTPASLKVMPGDVVRVRHDAAPWGQALGGDARWESFEVIDVADNPDETRDFLLRIYNAATYPDTAGPAQNLIGTTPRGLPLPPPPPRVWSLTANLFGDLRLAHDFPLQADYREGFLDLLIDDISARYWDGSLPHGFTVLDGAIDESQTVISVDTTGAFQVGDYVTVGFELMKIVGPGLLGSDPDPDWEVARAQLGSVAAAKGDNATVRRLKWHQIHFTYAPGYSLANPTLDLVNGPFPPEHRFRPGSILVLYATLHFANRKDQLSPKVTRLLSQYAPPIVAGALPGLRVYKGIRHELLAVNGGPVRIGADLIQAVTLGPGESIGLLYAAVERVPQGQSILFQPLLNGASISDFLFGGGGPVVAEIPADAFGSGSFFRGDFLGNQEDQTLGGEFLQVGAGDEPGEGFKLIAVI